MIIITGYKGFIGGYLLKELAKFVDDVFFIRLDVKDGRNLLTCELPKGDIEYIFHLAAQSDVMASWDDPLHDLDNIRITARLAKEYPKAKIIYASSCAGMDRKSPYGFSKWASGEYLKCFHENSVICVFPNIYGKGSRSVVDIFKENTVIKIYGDGKQTRDYVHVEDLVKGLIKAMWWKPGEYFMGSGKSTTVNELVEIIAKQRKIKYADARKEPYEVIVPNTTPNWQPKINVLEYIAINTQNSE